ncbi:hypothetical protein DL766_003601 [Monosporascus sp. MC13-8B]|uniref:Uncharacterized protein n=1 Tax=Monosporascus cannonballus TaxID=155416 RepID=A0ABY0HAW4_9PEZI|nr:hypothetical protein DL762_003339 [Monosporascus cannonballus]RYP00535.1 hypothetical protein DL763_000732 [Monosporascus cannonballus]RYP33169.1 hypothetical protein DL766_003601 [Monosporascus sp. MC13-8B]
MGHHRPAPAVSAPGLPCQRNHQQTGIAGATVRDRCPAAIATATSGGTDTSGSGSGYGRPDSDSVCNERCTTETTYAGTWSISAVSRRSTCILVRCCSPISSRSRNPVLTYRYLLPHPTTTTIPETCHFHCALTCASTTSTSTSISQSLSKSSQPDEAPEHPSPPTATPTFTANPCTSSGTFGQHAVPVPQTLPQRAVRAHVQGRTGKDERL